MTESNSCLGEEFDTVFELIKNDLFSLRYEWRIYTSLFGTNPERVELLNEVSAQVAGTIDRHLFEGCIIAICRLTDPEEFLRSGSKNISVKHLVRFMKTDKQKEHISDLINDCISKASFARSWRNKKIAHSDLDVRKKAKLMETASRFKVSEAIDAIARIIRWIGEEFFESDIRTHPISPFSSDEVKFLKYLYDGRNHAQEKEIKHMELVKSGKHSEAHALYTQYPDWVTFRPDDFPEEK